MHNLFEIFSTRLFCGPFLKTIPSYLLKNYPAQNFSDHEQNLVKTSVLCYNFYFTEYETLRNKETQPPFVFQVRESGFWEGNPMSDTAEKALPTAEQLRAELAREKYKNRYGQTLRSTVYILLVASAIAVLLASLLFPVFRIYGSSMAPTMNEGEIVVSLKGSSFLCGDVVVLNFNNKLLVKRVIAGPGDWVDIDWDGNVYVNEKLIDEPYLQEKAYGECNLDLPYQVPDGRYFVMGDNRATSQDSRNSVVGCIPDEQIIGRAIFRIWPFSEIGTIKQ